MRVRTLDYGAEIKNETGDTAVHVKLLECLSTLRITGDKRNICYCRCIRVVAEVVGALPYLAGSPGKVATRSL